MHFGGLQHLCLLNCLRSKNTLKQGKGLNFWNWQLNPWSWKTWKGHEKVMEFEELNGLWTLPSHLGIFQFSFILSFKILPFIRNLHVLPLGISSDLPWGCEYGYILKPCNLINGQVNSRLIIWEDCIKHGDNLLLLYLQSANMRLTQVVSLWMPVQVPCCKCVWQWCICLQHNSEHLTGQLYWPTLTFGTHWKVTSICIWNLWLFLNGVRRA